jgi:hypothetical protein
VSTDDRVRRQSLDLTVEASRVELLDRASQAIGLRFAGALVGPAVEIAPQERGSLDELDVRIRIELAEGRRHQIHHVDVRHPPVRMRQASLRCQRFGGAHVAGSRGHAEHGKVDGLVAFGHVAESICQGKSSGV